LTPQSSPVDISEPISTDRTTFNSDPFERDATGIPSGCLGELD
jgi:hypothetical protein